jgi:hypothetical protein
MRDRSEFDPSIYRAPTFKLKVREEEVSVIRIMGYPGKKFNSNSHELDKTKGTKAEV